MCCGAITSRGRDLKYSPDQPRVPAGNPDGGQWTSEASGGASGDFRESSGDAAEGTAGNGQAHTVPTNDSRIIADATPDNTWIPGAQYAGGIEEGEAQGSIRGEPAEGRPAQEATLVAARAKLQEVLSQVQALDPNWKATPGLYETIAGEIADLEAQTREALNHLSELARIGIGPGPFAGQSIPARGAERDFTNEERDEINRIGAESGCHTCGTNEAGTSSGNFVPDHQPPNALNLLDWEQRLYPQCLTCSLRQGGFMRQYLKRGR